MRKIIFLLIIVFVMIIGCKKKSIAKNVDGKHIKLFVDGVEVEVDWENNESVKQLSEIAKLNDLVVKTHRYGGFEQVGDIGQNIISDNAQMITEPGDIVLYNGNNHVVFFGRNSWSYKK